MKILYNKELLEIGSAGLRCARWSIKHRKDKKHSKFLKGYYDGKWFAYLYVLSFLGYTEFLHPKIVLEIDEFLERKRKGWRIIWKSEVLVLIMRKNFFEKVLESKQPHQGSGIIKEMRRIFKEI